MVSRSDFDNSVISKADVAAMYGEEESAVSMVSYGNREYFSLTTEQYVTVLEITARIPLTALVRCENGYIYVFQFSGAKDSPYFADFEELVTSVEYPTFENDEAVRDQVLGSCTLLMLFVLAALCVLIVWGCHSAIRKRSIKKKRQEDSSIPEQAVIRVVPAIPGENEEGIPPEPPAKEPGAEPAAAPVMDLPETTEVFFCHRCGSRLVSGSLFCNRCGAKIHTTKE